jgi:16S rRNA (cytidine1402-2'-O)-methyltransferase
LASCERRELHAAERSQAAQSASVSKRSELWTQCEQFVLCASEDDGGRFQARCASSSQNIRLISQRYRLPCRHLVCKADAVAQQGFAGVVVLAATPIGDVADASQRLVAELTNADVIAAEDTRRLRRLLERLGVETGARIMSYFEGNEKRRTDELIRALGEGARVVVVSDSGMPLVSDPGYRLVTAAVARGFRVTAVPGPSAVLTALAISGLPVDRFCFEGFLPRKAAERARRLGQLATEPRTMIFFEAPHRAAATLSAMAIAFGPDRRGAVCRELTKTYEEVRRGSLHELAEWAASDVRGEVTLVVGGGTQPTADLQAAAEEALGLAAGGMKLRAAVAQVARQHGAAKNAVYEVALKMQHPRPGSAAPEGEMAH